MLTVTSLFADDPQAVWHGVKVLPKKGAVVKVGAKLIDTSNWSLPYTVQNVNGEWLWIGTKEQGWVKRSQVVTIDEAPLYYTELITRNPNDAWAYGYRAIALDENGELDLAIADYNDRVRLKPDATVYNNRGVAWKKKGEFEKALADFDEAIRLEPKYSFAYYNRGHVQNLQHEYQGAIDDLSRAIELSPNYSPAYHERANAYYGRRDYAKAVEDYDATIGFEPNSALAYNNRGNAWRVQGEYEKAMSDHNRAMELDPDYAGSYNSLAWLLATCPNTQYRNGMAAVAMAQKACELTGEKDANSLGTLAAAYAEAGEFENAVKTQQKAIDLLPTDDGRLKTAKRHLKRFRERNPYREEGT